MKRNIIAILASAVMLTVSGCSAPAVSGSDIEKPEKYELEPDVPIEHSFDPADHEWYGDVSAKLADYADVIEIPEKLTRREVKWFLDKIHNDHPDIFWLQSYYNSTKSNTTKIDFVLPEDYTKEEEMKMHQELLDKVDEIVAALPGIKSPTVMPLAQEGWCSVHTVLDQKRFWEIIGKLKALGAQGILVLPIEKMIV